MIIKITIVDSKDDSGYCIFALKNKKEKELALVQGREVPILKTNIAQIISELETLKNKVDLIEKGC